MDEATRPQRGPKKKRQQPQSKKEEVREELRKEWEARCNKMVDDFLADHEALELPFPSTLTPDQRKVVHQVGVERQLASMSEGEGNKRFVKLCKKISEDPFTLETLPTDLRLIFIKEFRLPITVHQPPYFEYFLDLYDDWYNTKTKMENFLAVVNAKDKGRVTFGGYKLLVEEKIIEAIQATEAFKRFSADTLESFIVQEPEKTEKKTGITNEGGEDDDKGIQEEYSVYDKSNVGKYFISLDLTSANFNALRYYDPEIVFNCHTWQELVARFTSFQHFIDSKPFRQKTLDHLNGEGQKRIINYLIHKVINSLIEGGIVTMQQVLGKKTDEVVIEVDEDKVIELAHKIKEHLKRALPDITFVKIEPFQLVKVGPLKCQLAGFVKEVLPLNDEDEDEKEKEKDENKNEREKEEKEEKEEKGKRKAIFKLIHPEYFAMVYRKYQGQPTTAYDRTWHQTSRGLQHLDEERFWNSTRKY